MVLTERACT